MTWKIGTKKIENKMKGIKKFFFKKGVGLLLLVLVSEYDGG